jgi:hypothetical protein
MEPEQQEIHDEVSDILCKIGIRKETNEEFLLSTVVSVEDPDFPEFTLAIHSLCFDGYDVCVVGDHYIGEEKCAGKKPEPLNFKAMSIVNLREIRDILKSQVS